MSTSETTLQARLGISSPGANGSVKKAWKTPKKPYIDDHRAQAAPAWASQRTTSSYEPGEGHQLPIHVSPPLIDRLGPKVPPKPRSLLERIDITMEAPTTGVTLSSDAVASSEVVREEDGEVYDADGQVHDSYHGSEDGEVMTAVQPTNFSTQARPSRNEFPTTTTSHTRTLSTPTMNSDRPDAYRAQNANSDTLTSEAAVVDAIPPAATPEIPVINTHLPDISFVEPDAGPDASRSQKRPPLSLQARIGRALKSAVFENAKLRGRTDTINSHNMQDKIDELVTTTVSESFGAQMRKVKQEMLALRADEATARTKGQLLNGFGNKSGVGDNNGNTWLNRRDSHSFIPSLASTSILPTPPPSEFLAESMNKAPPKAPKAMLGIYTLPSKSISLKGKEKAIEPLEDDESASRARRHSYTSTNLRPRHSLPDRERSLQRRTSTSPSRTPLAPHKRGFADEMPTYRSPPSRIHHSPPDRRGSLRSRSRSRMRPESATTRRVFRSPSRSSAHSNRRPSPRSRSRPRRAISSTRSFNSRHPSLRSTSRSPPPSASHSSSFRRRSSRSRSAARDLSRGRTFSSRRSRSPGLNSRYPHDKRPSVRSPSPYRGRRGSSIHAHRSRSPIRKRKLSRSPTPPVRRRRSPSFCKELVHRGRGAGSLAEAPDSTPHGKFDRDYGESPTQLLSPFGPQPPPATRVPDSSPAPSAANPCNNVPGLWFVKVGADASKVLEGRFVIEPEFATTWNIISRCPSTLAPPTHLPNPKLSVVLLCLQTAAVSTLYNSLKTSTSTAENMAKAVAALETAWPSDGTLLLEMNKEGGSGKTWLPHDIDPASPLDVTEYIQPGPNIIRFIQLANMVERTFILYASRLGSATNLNGSSYTSLRDMDVDDEWPFEDDVQNDDPLFKFCATVTVS